MMKATILTLMFLVTLGRGFGQMPSSDDYGRKAVQQRRTGRVLAIGGTCAVILGATILSSTWESSDYTTTDAGGYLMLAGLAADMASIPFFIGASYNKRKAVTVRLNSTRLEHLSNKAPAHQFSIGVSMKFYVAR